MATLADSQGQNLSSTFYWFAASSEGWLSNYSTLHLCFTTDFLCILAKRLRCYSHSPSHVNNYFIYQLSHSAWLCAVLWQSWCCLSRSKGTMEYDGTGVLWYLWRIRSDFSITSTEPVLKSPVGYRRILYGVSKSHIPQYILLLTAEKK